MSSRVRVDVHHCETGRTSVDHVGLIIRTVFVGQNLKQGPTVVSERDVRAFVQSGNVGMPPAGPEPLQPAQDPCSLNEVAFAIGPATGAPDSTAAWKMFFEPGDVVGVKVNPVGKPKAMGERLPEKAFID